MAGFLRSVVESDRGENGNESIGSRRVASVLGRGSEVLETGLEEDGKKEARMESIKDCSPLMTHK